MKIVRLLFVLPIQFYRYALSPLMTARCRFYPSCSSYALEAILLHGVIRGSFYATKRILRCHPWNEGGYDPVPPLKLRTTKGTTENFYGN